MTTQNRVKISSTFWLVSVKILVRISQNFLLVSIAKSEQSSGQVETMTHKMTGRYSTHDTNPERAKDSTKQNVGRPDETQQIQTEPEIQQKPCIDPAKMTAGSNKTNSRVRQTNSQTQQNRNPKNSGKEDNSQIKWRKGGCQPNVDWLVSTKSSSQKTTTTPKSQTQQVRRGVCDC